MSVSRLRFFPLCLSAGLLLLIAQCSLPPESNTQILRAEPVNEAELFPTALALNVPAEAVTLNDTARFLAGLPALYGQDAFADMRKSAVWRSHSSQMDGLFHQFGLRHGKPVTAWANANLGYLRSSRSVFYPFSGPDFLFAHLFYPDAETYLLCGLEPCEPLPRWDSLSTEEITSGLDGLVTGLDTILQYSYFITKEMRQDFQSTRFRGVLPSFLVFLVRTGHIVESVNSVQLDASGNPVMLPSSQSTVPGLLIRFRGAGGQPKRLFYFSQNLANDSCKPGGPFLRFASSLGRPAALAKSASYLMHESYFSNIRNHILTQTSGIVQDPSGVPYRSFLEKNWNIELFGNYVRVQDIFKEYEQHDLIQAYQSPAASVRPISFGIGYLTDPSTTSLMIAWPR